MSPANQAKIDALKAQLPPRPRAADLWDAMSRDERAVKRRSFIRSSSASAEEATPVNVYECWDMQSWRGQRAIARMLLPVIRESDRIARNGVVSV